MRNTSSHRPPPCYSYGKLGIAAIALLTVSVFPSSATKADDCEVHSYDKTKDLFPGVGLALTAKLNGTRLAEGNIADLGQVPIDTRLSFELQAKDLDQHVCGEPPIPNRIEDKTIIVRVRDWTQTGDFPGTPIELKSELVAPGMKERVWKGSWTVPEGALGKTIYLWYEGKADDENCSYHTKSYDPVLTIGPMPNDKKYRMKLVVRHKVGFKQLSETKNPANRIFNPTPKDDPINDKAKPDADGNTFGVPLNNLYHVTDPAGTKYRVTLEASIKPISLSARVVGAVFDTKGNKYSGTDTPFGSFGICPIVFGQIGPDNNINDYVLCAGLDKNSNGKLDADEMEPEFVVRDSNGKVIGVPTVRASTLHSYSMCRWWVIRSANRVRLYPNGSALLRIFHDGNTSGVMADRLPSARVSWTMNCFGGPYSEWLTHNAGGAFSAAGIASINNYVWSLSTQPSKDVADAKEMKQFAIDYYKTQVEPKEVADFFRKNPTIDDHPFSVTIVHPSLSPAWVPPLPPGNPPQPTIEFKDSGDLAAAIGRGRVVEHKGDFDVHRTKDPSGKDVLSVTAWRSYGTVEDLYDFNFEQARRLALPRKAATVQIGHGNGSYGRKAGVIFVDTFHFDRSYPGF